MHGPPPPDCARLKGATFIRRFLFASAGIRVALIREKSFRTQTLLALAAAAAIAVMRPGWLWAALVALSVALVLALEMMNAALEYLTDHLHPELALEIKHAKDAAAGAVLIASLASATVGALMMVATLLD
jgi:diacylglycerol kinase